MSKPNSNLFHGTIGHNLNSKSISKNKKILVPSEKQLTKNVIRWAQEKANELSNISKRKREQFKSATIAYDIITGLEFYGRNGGVEINKAYKNPLLFGDKVTPGLLPKNKLDKYEIGNCSEVDAVNQALNAGANITNIVIKTINTTSHKQGEFAFGSNKLGCINCKYTFDGIIKKNYSGWKEN